MSMFELEYALDAVSVIFEKSPGCEYVSNKLNCAETSYLASCEPTLASGTSLIINPLYLVSNTVF